MPESFLTPDVVRAVVDHMNGDHAEDNVVICRGLGGRREVESATMTGLDEDAIEFLAQTPSGPITVRIPFGEPLRDRPQVREAVARLFHRSEDLLRR